MTAHDAPELLVGDRVRYVYGHYARTGTVVDLGTFDMRRTEAGTRKLKLYRVPRARCVWDRMPGRAYVHKSTWVDQTHLFVIDHACTVPARRPEDV